MFFQDNHIDAAMIKTSDQEQEEEAAKTADSRDAKSNSNKTASDSIPAFRYGFFSSFQ